MAPGFRQANVPKTWGFAAASPSRHFVHSLAFPGLLGAKVDDGCPCAISKQQGAVEGGMTSENPVVGSEGMASMIQ